MAEEAFALSPISARASLPSEADYEAIREAFMETARGRWFLSEYAKRNRNADTHMVLDAVARIEQTIATQKPATPTASLRDVLGAIRAIVADAKAKASGALSRPQGEEIFAAARDGARIIREVASALRECGADARICDLLDIQVSAIDAGHRQIGAPGNHDAVLAAFDVLMLRISELADGVAASGRSGPATPQAVKPSPAAEPAPPVELPTVQELRQPAAEPVARAEPVAKAEPTARAEPAAKAEPLAPAEPKGLIKTVAEIAAEQSAVEVAVSAQLDKLEASAQASSFKEPADLALPPPDDVAIDDQRDADDDAQDLVLEAVALEMSAPVFVEPETPEPDVAVPEPEEIDVIATAPVATATIAEPAPPPSLGAALIARGMVSKPPSAASDLLAPIRRMSQAERIAFFS